MEVFEAYLQSIENLENREKMSGLLHWVKDNYPSLSPQLKWNQPMFTDHDTFIIGFSVSKQHIAVSPEVQTMDVFREKLEQAGYAPSNNLFRIKWGVEINKPLLKELIAYNIAEKKDCGTFWRK